VNLDDAINFFAQNLQLSHILNIFIGGQKRKLYMTISVLGNPPIVIMDKPGAGVHV
jgi:ABC-type multidrug transport system ATPase subunit